MRQNAAVPLKTRQKAAKRSSAIKNVVKRDKTRQNATKRGKTALWQTSLKSAKIFRVAFEKNMPFHLHSSKKF
jgi:hypothetical protein